MRSLDDIRITVEQDTGNIVPLLHEIEHALRRLVDSGETTVIDLLSIPLAPGEGDQLERLLGEGEVRVELRSLGPSVIQETVYPGVWIATHYNADQELMTKLIEITRMPGILMSQDADVLSGIARLAEQLAEL